VWAPIATASASSSSRSDAPTAAPRVHSSTHSQSARYMHTQRRPHSSDRHTAAATMQQHSSAHASSNRIASAATTAVAAAAPATVAVATVAAAVPSSASARIAARFAVRRDATLLRRVTVSWCQWATAQGSARFRKLVHFTGELRVYALFLLLLMSASSSSIASYSVEPFHIVCALACNSMFLSYSSSYEAIQLVVLKSELDATIRQTFRVQMQH
jgi:hypothetical protein